jgi:TetR/AcrR family transcriptional regulator, cholesterol catabolism regulator
MMRLGIKSLTMDDIARELGISKKTLYQHFENKSDLVYQMGQMHVDEECIMMRDTTGDSGDALDEMIRMVEWAKQELSLLTPGKIYELQKYYPETWKLFDDHSKKNIFNHIKQNIERGIKEGLYKPDINADIIAKLYVVNSKSIIDEELFPWKDFDRRALFTDFFNYHINGIATEKGLKKFSESKKNK